MSINKRKLESLIDTVVLPFERFIVEDSRLAPYIADAEVAKIHNLAVTKLSIYIYSDINRAKDYVKEGAKAHITKLIPVENLKEFYSLYFTLCRDWNAEVMPEETRYLKNLASIEQFVFEVFQTRDELMEDFFIYDSEVIKNSLEKMHYSEESKITAEAFYEEGSMDNSDILDIQECSSALSEVVHDAHIDYNEEYFTRVTELFYTYAAVLEKNSEFKDIGFSLLKLSSFLKTNSEILPEHPKKKMAIVVLGAIVDDLITWGKSVLQEKTAIDIHYLDASLLSSIIQLEMLFSPVKEESDDDMEFF